MAATKTMSSSDGKCRGRANAAKPQPRTSIAKCAASWMKRTPARRASSFSIATRSKNRQRPPRIRDARCLAYHGFHEIRNLRPRSNPHPRRPQRHRPMRRSRKVRTCPRADFQRQPPPSTNTVHLSGIGILPMRGKRSPAGYPYRQPSVRLALPKLFFYAYQFLDHFDEHFGPCF